MKRPVFAANWKMNTAPADAAEFMRQFLAHYPRQQDRTVLIFPPALSLHAVVSVLRGRPDIQLGVQNVHWEDRGAFTGENSAPIAYAAGARYALVGHSERRHVFQETAEETGLKVAAAARAGLTAVVCVGETLVQREEGKTLDVVLGQLRAAFGNVDASCVTGSLVAYEPVWAIGTGKTATPQDASTVHAALRRELTTLTGGRQAGVPLLYGGSVNRSNSRELLAAPGVDGLLVGGASLEAETWAGIVRA